MSSRNNRIFVVFSLVWLISISVGYILGGRIALVKIEQLLYAIIFSLVLTISSYILFRFWTEARMTKQWRFFVAIVIFCLLIVAQLLIFNICFKITLENVTRVRAWFYIILFGNLNLAVWLLERAGRAANK